MKRVFVILLFFVPLLHAQTPTGTGTANYFAKWSSSTNLTTSALCQSASGGLVGVATCSPRQRLQVNSGNVLVKGLNNFIAKGQTAKYYVGDTNHAVGALYGGGLFLSTHNLPMAIVITDAPSIEASSVGYIGLGTTAPSALVDIEAGNAKCGTDFCVHGTTLFKVADSISVDLLGHITLGVGGPGSPDILLQTGLAFPDGTIQTTAYNPSGASATNQTATIQQLQQVVRELQARVAQLERAARK